MCEAIVAYIQDAIKEAKEKGPSRELSLVITKLEEALLWYQEHQRRSHDSR